MQGISFKSDVWIAKQQVLEQKGETVTRRIMNPQPLDSYLPDSDFMKMLMAIPKHTLRIHDKDNPNFIHIIPAPKYHVGQVVYVKETWRYFGGEEYEYQQEQKCVIYKNDVLVNITDYKWRSPRLMPAWAARYFIKITDVRPERLQEITEEDAMAEGCTIMAGLTSGGNMGLASARYEYMTLWDSINPKYLWVANPWVWRLAFLQMEQIENPHLQRDGRCSFIPNPDYYHFEQARQVFLERLK